MITAYTLLSVLLVSVVSLVGAFTLSIRADQLRRYLFVLVSLAIGALLGDAFIHLIPEAFETATNPLAVSLSILGGMLLFFTLEKYLHWHHHADVGSVEPHIHPVGRILLVSDGLHNFIDGIVIGLAYLVSPEIGIATTVAVILHEIPQEFGDFGVLLEAGYTRARALWLNFLTGLCSVAGALLALALGSASENIALWLLPLTAGGFIYIALADLVPELHKTRSGAGSVIQLAMIALGVALMVALLGLE